jgi:membrane protein implicated in regulation of membrane protease activity
MFGIEAIDYWHWLVLAVALFILEIFSPAAFFIWIGIAAGLMGLLLLAGDFSWQAQFLIFAVLSVVCVIGGRTWFKRNPIATDEPNLNRRGQSLVGRIFEVEQSIVDGTGRIRVGDTTWKVRGPDSEVGEKVMVVGIDSAVLCVERVE